MARRKVDNPFANRKPDAKEMAAAVRLARKVSPKLLALMNARTKE